ncbi:MAG: DUF4038 domain-containing protein, partial [Verrucomicrobia bacterium]|nr:DUF4038 domain-containing protein [Verrucomicrobiota bacterium]
MTTMRGKPHLAGTLCVFFLARAAYGAEVGQWEVFETSFETTKAYAKPFANLEVDVVFRQGDKQWIMPAFWAGGGKWTVRFAPPVVGEYRYRVQSTDKANTDFNGAEQVLRVQAYTGSNPLLKHGFLRVGADQRHFEHADGTPFFWLGDTWWKGLCKRLTWEGFQELTADRRAKGFSVVQIVCGVYPDEGLFEPRWENEGGKPYLTRDFSVVNPKYFEYADRRIRHLVESGIVPAIVGGWSRGDCNGMAMVGVAGMKRHWRHLVARYGAYPTIWIIAGETGGPQWTEVTRYVHGLDPYAHPVTIHNPHNARTALTDEKLLDFDMLETSHEDWKGVDLTIARLKSSYASREQNAMPVMVGEACYEGHMQLNLPDVQRHLFWATMLNGSAGHTYGAAGVWHASVKGDPGITPVYDVTTWEEGMNYPGSTQLGIGKKLLEQYPWARFEPHPEWAPGCYTAGIPGEVRFVYLPRRNIYNWSGPEVKDLEPDVDWHVYYFDPATGRSFDQGMIKATAKAGDAAAKPVSFRKNVPSPQDWVLVFERINEPIQLHPDNPHYLLWSGKPAVLVTSGEHYGAVMNAPFDYVAYLEELQSVGLNLTRLFSGVYCEARGDFDIKDNTLAPGPRNLLCPYARSGTPGYANGGNKFDLTKWDEAYFKRLKDFVAQAGKRGIVVEFTFFCPYYSDSQWNLSPFNAQNHINGTDLPPINRENGLVHPKLLE